MQGWLQSRSIASIHSRVSRSTELLREPIGAGHLLPDQQAQPVGPIEIARIFDLLVLADAVEAHRLGQLDVAAQGVVVGRGQPGLRPVALVEHHAAA